MRLPIIRMNLNRQFYRCEELFDQDIETIVAGRLEPDISNRTAIGWRIGEARPKLARAPNFFNAMRREHGYCHKQLSLLFAGWSRTLVSGHRVLQVDAHASCLAV